MHIRLGTQMFKGSAIVAVLLVSFLFPPFLNLIPHARATETPEDWWNASWPCRKLITINHSNVSGILEDFPVLINVTDDDLAGKAQLDGDDIVFVDADTNMKLEHEIEYFNKALGQLVAWVSLPLLNDTSDSRLYMYYGNPSAGNQQNRTRVWDSNFLMVQHLQETSGTRFDSTGYGNDGTPYGGVGKSPSGKIDGADAFDGVNDHFRQTTLSLLGENESMIESWIYISSVPAVVRWAKTHMYGRSLPSDPYWYGFWIALPNISPIDRFVLDVRLYNPVSASTTTFSQTVFLVDQWVHVAWGLSKLTNRTYFYVNGALVRSDDISAMLKNGFITPLDDPYVKGFSIASNIKWQEYTKMMSDEVRISNIVRSASWVLTSYNNQKDTSKFYAISEEEKLNDVPSYISDEEPQNDSIDVYTNPTLSIHATNIDGDPMTIVFSTNATGIWQDIEVYSNAGDGTYNCTPTTMTQLGTRYFWRASVSDGSGWVNETYSFTTTEVILTQKWRAAQLPFTVTGVLVANVVGDAREEIIHAGEGAITLLNGSDGRIIWRTGIDNMTRESKPEMADLNRDGILEIVVPIEYPAGVHVLYGNNGSTYWRRTDLGGYALPSPVIADIDGSGYPVIFVATMFTSPPNGLNSTGRITSLSYDGQLLHQTFSWHPCDGGLSIADADNDGELEVYMGDRNMYYTEDPGYGSGVVSFWAKNLTLRWAHPNILCSSHRPMLADVNGDGVLEVIAGTQRGGLAILNSTDGSTIKIDWSIGIPIHYQPSVYDIDGDGNLEILAADGAHDIDYPNYYDNVVFDLVKWEVDARLSIGNSYYGPQVADVSGDSIMDIIACNYTGIFVFNRTYNLIANVTGLLGWLTYAVVQDVDGDGYNELVVATTGGMVYAFDTPARRSEPRARTEVRFYSERRLGAAEYVPPPGSQAPVISAPSPVNEATAVPTALSQLSFIITDFQYDSLNYWVTTTPEIGVGSGFGVYNGRFSVTVSNLEYDTTYMWKVCATDGKSWTNKTFTFATESEVFWWNTSWTCRKMITIDSTKVDASQTNFPILIDLTDNSLAGKAQLDGDDFVFTDANQNKLYHEIELYDNTNGHLVAWVNVPLLSSTNSIRLYVYYGNPDAANQQNPTAVWDTSYKMVLHFDEALGTHYDSTINGNDGTSYGGVAQGVEGKIDGADSFDGVNDYVRVQHSNSITGFAGAFTASFWLRLDDTTRRQTILNKYDVAGNQRGWYIDYEIHATYGKVLALFASQDGVSYKDWYASFNPVAGVWYYIAVVWESGKVPKFYINGLQVPTKGTAKITSIFNNTGTPLYIGRCYPSVTTRNLKGRLDEIRISSIASTAGWILTNYKNLKDPASFYTIGNEETLPKAPNLIVPSPFNEATDVPASLHQLSFYIIDYQGDRMSYTVKTFPDIGSGSATNVGDGRCTISIGNLSRSTTYAWMVNVTDGTNWTNKTFTFTTESESFWWNTSWQYRKTITIDPAKVSSAQTDFPVLVELTDGDLANKTRPDGEDIVFTDSNNAKLSHEIEHYDISSGHLIAWVNVPILSSTAYTRIFLYYGNPSAANQQNTTAVWNPSHELVLHLSEASGTHYDSTINGNDGTPHGGVAQGVEGKIDAADSFDGIDDYVQVPHGNSITGFAGAFTASFWLRLDDTTRRQTILNKYDVAGNQRGWFIDYEIHATYGKVLALFASQDGVSYKDWYASFNPVAGVWYYIAVVWESGKVPKFYINGLQVSTIRTARITSIFNNTGTPLYIGRCYPSVTTRNLKGRLDEIRISSIASTAGWILTNYNDQKGPANFYTIGNEEMTPVGPVVSVPSPSNYTTRSPLSLDRLSFNLVSYRGKMMNYTVMTTPNIGSGSGTNVFDGRYSISIGNLTPSTTYTWIINATDGIYWTIQQYTFTTYPGAPPTQDNPLLTSTDGKLIAYNQTTYDRNGDTVTNIYNWYRNNTSITNLLLPFDTNSSTIKDYSGYGNNGVIIGRVTWTSDGKVGGAYEFDRGYMQIPGTSTLDGGGEWSEITVEQWICLTAYVGGTRTIAKIPSYEIGINWNKVYAGIWVRSDTWNVTGYHQVVYDTSLHLNTWYHIAFTYKNGTGLTLYIDGIPVATTPVSGNIQASGSVPLYLGWFDYLEGKIDEVRIYPKSLSPQQIYQRYLETKEGLSSSSTIVREETQIGEDWKCQVTPNDSYQDGVAKFSNTITIIEDNQVRPLDSQQVAGSARAQNSLLFIDPYISIDRQVNSISVERIDEIIY